MKIDSISTISEIVPYFGYFDDTYKLMKRLNRATNKMWNKTWNKLSELVNRRKIDISWEIREEFVDLHLKFPLFLALFDSDPVDIHNEEKYEWLIELFKNFEFPKLIKVKFGLRLCKDGDTFMTFTDYSNWLNQKEFSYLKLYNILMDIAINKEITFSCISSYIFINEISSITNAKYVKSIIFPWKKENQAESMIKILKDFIERKQFEYTDIKLIWDGMEYNEFMKIYFMVLNLNIKIEVITEMDRGYVSLFLNEWCHNTKYGIYYKIGGKYSCILYDSSNLKNEIKLRNWFYLQSSKNAIEISDLYIHYLNKSIISESGRIKLSFDDVIQMKFKIKGIITNKGLLNFNNIINIKKNSINFENELVRVGKYRFNSIDKWIYLPYCKISPQIDEIECMYSKIHKCIDIKIPYITFCDSEANEFSEEIEELGNLRSISFTIKEPSSAIIILNSCENYPFLSTISVKLECKPTILEYITMKETVERLKSHIKSVKIDQSSFNSYSF